jgi:hypothetical protein
MWGWSPVTREGEGGLIKNDMARYDDTIRRKVEAAITLVVRRIAEEGTKGGARSEFVGSGGSEVGITSAPKNAKVMVGG